MVQLGLLGLQVLPEGLLQCRTQQWNSSVSTNRGVGVGGVGGGGGGKRVGGGGCRERKTEVEGGGGCIGERTGRGWGCGAQITSHHCYSPAQGQQQREARCPVSCTVSASPASSLREERKTESSECDPFIAHPHTHTHRKTDYHSCKNKIKPPKNSTRKQTENFKNQNKRKKTD